MNIWKNFRDYFLKESLSHTSDIFEKARIRMTFTLCFIGIVLMILLDITLIASHLYFSLLLSLAINVGIFVSIYYILVKKNHRAGAKIVVITVFTGISIDLIFSETIGLVDILWYALLILFTFFTLNSTWGAVITICSIAISFVYVFYFFYDNFHNEEIYSAGQLIALLITIVFGYVLVFLFVKEARDAEIEAELKLKENIFSLEDLNKKLESLNAELKTSNKNLESFTYSVSHDLRAPLRAVIGYSGILSKKHETKLDEEAKGTIATIVRSAEKMNQLINDLLNFSRSGTKELGMEEIDTTVLLKEVISEYEKNEGKISAELKISHLPGIKGDKSLLKQVLYNLISNAVKYSSKKEKPTIEVGATTKETEHVFYVKDNGAGFDMQYADKLFSIFQRLHTEAEFKGTGIGLAIVKQIITRHGGNVWAESKLNEGSTFYFSLPVR